MKSFDERSAVGGMLKAGTRTIAMSLGHPKAKGLIGDFQKRQEGLKKNRDLNNDAEDALIMANAECDLHRELANETAEEFQIALEGVVRKDWSDPLYKACFPKGLTAFKDQASIDYAANLPALVSTLNESGDATLKKFVPRFEKHAKDFDKPLSALAEAEKAARAAGLKLSKGKIEWLDAYAALEGSFNATFPRRKRFVASFFPQASGSSKKSGPPTGGEGQG